MPLAAKSHGNAYVKPASMKTVADQDWMQIKRDFRCHRLPDLFIEMLLAIRAPNKAYDAGFGVMVTAWKRTMAK